MKVKYFHDTATALIWSFLCILLLETKEINENIYIDLDANENLVAITIEHADLHANLPDLFYEQVGASRIPTTFTGTNLTSQIVWYRSYDR